ncbi:DNA recombination protein RmuC [Ammoniphilus resinae]|uniref:DNA recombination protein RmuC n=1 Tax=Ammoniphilus resinae TaxID=861532 RepID=A0ABS4GTX9_9BACL|nr:DNA recombination protein RmuC [Ammoniphilus resinae]MBP1933725.1 DNA recombination protein RmuC [Ammoniphilus resinae]
METFIPIGSLIVNMITLVLLFILWSRKPVAKNPAFEVQLLSIEKAIDRLERSIREEISQNRAEAAISFKQNRDDLTQSLRTFNQMVLTGMSDQFTQQKNLFDSFSKQISELTFMNDQKFEQMRGTVEGKLDTIQKENNLKLEQMRMTVDEKLHATLEKRLGESFRLVSERLEQVHKGLGEMQNLASGVGDLKKVLTNVKTRGTLGEIQLENLLEQTLTIEQYDKNVITRDGSNDRVEFAVKLPDKDEKDKYIYLPIDSKFPLEDYHRLLEAEEIGDLNAVGDAAKQLESRIKREAKNIQSKYLGPYTTDFAIMFLPIEGLFAEILRRPGLWETLQREYRIIVTGPTTLTALLNSLHMGFRTLAIQKRSSEVWKVLGAIKTEFGNFGTILTKAQKKLQEANNVIDSAFVRTRAIERNLKTVEELPVSEAKGILQLEDLNLVSNE